MWLRINYATHLGIHFYICGHYNKPLSDDSQKKHILDTWEFLKVWLTTAAGWIRESAYNFVFFSKLFRFMI